MAHHAILHREGEDESFWTVLTHSALRCSCSGMCVGCVLQVTSLPRASVDIPQYLDRSPASLQLPQTAPADTLSSVHEILSPPWYAWLPSNSKNITVERLTQACSVSTLSSRITMDLFQWSFLLLSILVIGISLLYRWSTSFNFHCKMALFFGWCTFWTVNMSIYLTPFVRRNPDNMK